MSNRPDVKLQTSENSNQDKHNKNRSKVQRLFISSSGAYKTAVDDNCPQTIWHSVILQRHVDSADDDAQVDEQVKENVRNHCGYHRPDLGAA